MGKEKTIKENKELHVVDNQEKKPYLTKRILISAAKQGFRKAAEETMKVMGYNVIARDGWVMKIFPDGRTEKISPLEPENTDYDLALD
ncbi:hypothetical protein CJD36_001485 [Flavipsychrobacter stenotrophus]|uniref:Uncharacterized protein n=1 Tax=Flavipsychrobacter stenotrophus TaxID=2077091 RepID=A0A2S7SZS1_9BACT|nr:hypothetical protein [Flavipsychrobacter stenotrophus]PQJ12449.1 hypothetical protein CJD36_001485 [Flavipsychrobacter stenotrophus]